MNMKKLSKEKRDNLILIALLTTGAVAGLGYGLIRYQYQTLGQLAEKQKAKANKLVQVQATLKRGPELATKAEELKTALTDAETDVASGDLYAWLVSTLRQFKGNYNHVDIPQFSQLGGMTEVNLLPNFPYKQASLTVAGTAYYHDLGRFLADLENQFPHMRVVNLSLDPAGATESAENEKLSFRMDILTLVKANQS